MDKVYDEVVKYDKSYILIRASPSQRKTLRIKMGCISTVGCLLLITV